MLFLVLIAIPIFAQTQLSQPDENTLIVANAPEMEIFAFGKTVIVKENAKGVLSFGGDVIIEGKVTGDVATIGGSVIQKKKGFIGGDVIIFGGKYRHEDEKPLRNDEKKTVMYAGYEEELRNLAQNPSQLFSPGLSWRFLAQRLASVLFWFLISFALVSVTPGAISRAAARFKISTLKVIGIGALVFLLINLTVLLSLEFLPGFIGVIVGLMAFVLMMLAYVFGRVTLQVNVGKWIAKKILPQNRRSETVSLLFGAVFWTLVLSIPYVWTLALFAVFAVSLGLVATARSKESWKRKNAQI